MNQASSHVLTGIALPQVRHRGAQPMPSNVSTIATSAGRIRRVATEELIGEAASTVSTHKAESNDCQAGGKLSAR